MKYKTIFEAVTSSSSAPDFCTMLSYFISFGYSSRGKFVATEKVAATFSEKKKITNTDLGFVVKVKTQAAAAMPGLLGFITAEDAEEFARRHSLSGYVVQQHKNSTKFTQHIRIDSNYSVPCYIEIEDLRYRIRDIYNRGKDLSDIFDENQISRITQALNGTARYTSITNNGSTEAITQRLIKNATDEPTSVQVMPVISERVRSYISEDLETVFPKIADIIHALGPANLKDLSFTDAQSFISASAMYQEYAGPNSLSLKIPLFDKTNVISKQIQTYLQELFPSANVSKVFKSLNMHLLLVSYPDMYENTTEPKLTARLDISDKNASSASCAVKESVLQNSNAIEGTYIETLDCCDMRLYQQALQNMVRKEVTQNVEIQKEFINIGYYTMLYLNPNQPRFNTLICSMQENTVYIDLLKESDFNVLNESAIIEYLRQSDFGKRTKEKELAAKTITEILSQPCPLLALEDIIE